MAYTSPYSDKKKTLLDELMNTPDFNYEANNDPSYQSYAKIYGNLGDRAMANTMSEASGLTGGRLNSWAVSAGQQAKQNFDQQLTDKIPALQQMAYNMYMDKLNNKKSTLSLLGQEDDREYSRWADDRDYTYRQNRDKASDSQWWSNFNENKRVSDRDYTYRQNRDKISDERYVDEKKDDADFGVAYQAMMGSNDPVKWLKENAPYLTPAEIAKLQQYLPDTDWTKYLK
jgi:hypothetical protein